MSSCFVDKAAHQMASSEDGLSLKKPLLLHSACAPHIPAISKRGGVMLISSIQHELQVLTTPLLLSTARAVDVGILGIQYS
jgi:hypothetical protein